MNKPKVLIIDDEENVREILAFALARAFNAEVLAASSAKQGIELVDSNPSLACVICDYNMPQANGEFVLRHIKSKHAGIPFIVSTSDELEDHPELTALGVSGYIQKPYRIEKLIELVRDQTKQLASLRLKQTQPVYFKIKTQTLLRVNLLHSDVYIKLSDDKYVKLLREGDCLTPEDIARYSQRSVEHLYIHESDCDIFLERFARDIFSLAANKAVSYDEFFEVGKQAYEAMQVISQKLGFSKHAMSLAKASVELALRTMQSFPRLTQHLQKISNEPESYLATHSIMTAHIACALSTLAVWDSEITRHKLALAAFIHDITLTDPKLARIRTLRDLEKSRVLFNDKEIARYKLHPTNAAAIVQEIAGLPAHLDTIIAQHHESPDQHGFPAGLGAAHMSPLTSLFIIAEEMIDFADSKEGRFDPQEYITAMTSRYGQGHFKHIFSLIVDSISKATL
ncbi:MAG: response regulator [Bdellovibrionota bacterium]